jgi:hypothetical protein
VDTFSRSSSGVAALHSLDLDFGSVAPNNQAILVLNGWVDWADGSTFIAAGQESKDGLIFPYLQVKDAAGQWKTVIEDMGIPSGKPKSIVIDLTGKFLSASREVRIVTNLCVYWDEIFLGEQTSTPDVKLTLKAPISTTVGFLVQLFILPERNRRSLTMKSGRHQPCGTQRQACIPVMEMCVGCSHTLTIVW